MGARTPVTVAVTTTVTMMTTNAAAMLERHTTSVVS